ncbi:hypothetical protein V5O48_000827 [Marasmius crinis-equi]|uniref:SH3 domain-containing protein n=1 Tax=Marasmius crinis-equi TaxID=585013 RepID=A0ABR3G074_9AGAR
MSPNLDTTTRRRRSAAPQRGRPNDSAGRGFLYRRQETDDTPGGSLPTGPLTITRIRTLTTETALSTSSSSTITTSRASSTSKTSSSSSSSVTSSTTPSLPSSSSSSSSTTDRGSPATQSSPSASAIDPTSTGSSADSNSSNSNVQNGGLSSGAIAGIAIAVVVVLAALIAYLVRRRMKGRRSGGRGDWYDRSGFSAPPPPPPAMTQAAPQFSAYDYSSGAMATPLYSQPRPPPAPPAAPFAMSDRPVSLIPGRRGSGFSSSSYSFQPESTAVPIATTLAPPPTASTPGKSATVRCTFVPSMADELSIETGDTIRVLQEYDDGWALCLNSQGMQGMVPLECLGDTSQGDKPNIRRESSLSAIAMRT